MTMPEVADPGVIALCACHDSAARFERGDESYVGQFRGQIAAEMMSPIVDGATTTMPLRIVGYSTQSDVPGLGAVSLDFDFSSEAEDSELSSTGEEFFPATQTMRLNITMTSDAFPGQVLRGQRTGVLVNDQVDNWPPTPGATYLLQEAVPLADDQGETQVTITEVNTEIVSSTFGPDAVVVGRGLQLDLGGVSPESTTPSVAFTIAEAGTVTVLQFASDGTELPAREEQLPTGSHSIDLDENAATYQLQIDGEVRSARMRVL